ncbi:hypothetical protein H0O00_02290 [Candidatus Micrarchaeota archaeon]|nr:hypothetical protein [Candidatus Micrarchaeota archaeon]
MADIAGFQKDGETVPEAPADAKSIRITLFTAAIHAVKIGMAFENLWAFFFRDTHLPICLKTVLFKTQLNNNINNIGWKRYGRIYRIAY